MLLGNRLLDHGKHYFRRSRLRCWNALQHEVYDLLSQGPTSGRPNFDIASSTASTQKSAVIVRHRESQHLAAVDVQNGHEINNPMRHRQTSQIRHPHWLGDSIATPESTYG
jgi:hypothetical protein